LSFKKPRLVPDGEKKLDKSSSKIKRQKRGGDDVKKEKKEKLQQDGLGGRLGKKATSPYGEDAKKKGGKEPFKALTTYSKEKKREKKAILRKRGGGSRRGGTRGKKPRLLPQCFSAVMRGSLLGGIEGPGKDLPEKGGSRPSAG